MSQARRALMETAAGRKEVRPRDYQDPRTLWVRSLDTFCKEATVSAVESSRKAEIQVKMGRARSSTLALYNSSKILIRLRNELESKATPDLLWKLR